jgi:hypothetical protein
LPPGLAAPFLFHDGSTSSSADADRFQAIMVEYRRAKRAWRRDAPPLSNFLRAKSFEVVHADHADDGRRLNGVRGIERALPTGLEPNP